MEGLKTVLELMAVSARTAPKSRGEDCISIKIIEGEDVKKLADAMYDYAEESGNKGFERDGKNVEDSPYAMLIGIKDARHTGLNCGACGSATCSEHDSVSKFDGEYKGPQCAFRLVDLGIALGSAVKTASMLNVDNRIIYRMGVAARRAGIVDWDVIMGIPLSATGKNIYFDRK